MRWADRLRDVFGSAAAVADLTRADRVDALVPTNATYVTAGLFAVLTDARAFVGGTPGQAPYRYTFGRPPTPDGPPQRVGLLVLAGGRLRVVDVTGERWSVEAEQVTDLDGHRHSGFVVLTRGPGGLAVGTQTPVQVPPGVGWRTVGGRTTVFSGWDAELEPYGPRIHR